MLRLRKFMFDRVYLGEEARSEQERAREVLRALFDHYLRASGGGAALDREADPLQRVTDYLAGMTDRFCIRSYEKLASSGTRGGGRAHAA